MADARLEKTTATIDVSNSNELFVAKGEVITFEGFLKVYLEGTTMKMKKKQKDFFQQ